MKVKNYDCNPSGYDYTITLTLENGSNIHYFGVEFYRGQHILGGNIIGLDFLEADNIIKTSVKAMNRD